MSCLVRIPRNLWCGTTNKDVVMKARIHSHIECGRSASGSAVECANEFAPTGNVVLRSACRPSRRQHTIGAGLQIAIELIDMGHDIGIALPRRHHADLTAIAIGHHFDKARMVDALMKTVEQIGRKGRPQGAATMADLTLASESAPADIGVLIDLTLFGSRRSVRALHVDIRQGTVAGGVTATAAALLDTAGAGGASPPEQAPSTMHRTSTRARG